MSDIDFNLPVIDAGLFTWDGELGTACESDLPENYAIPLRYKNMSYCHRPTFKLRSPRTGKMLEMEQMRGGYDADGRLYAEYWRRCLGYGRGPIENPGIVVRVFTNN